MSSWLSAHEATGYAHLTTPSLADALHSVSLPTIEMGTAQGLHAAGLTFAGLPAALAMLQRHDGSVLTIVSLAVNAPFRQLGLARQLLDWLMAEAERLGCSRLMVSYPLNHASTAAMQRLTSPARRWQHRPGLRLVNGDRSALSIIVSRLTPLAERWLSRGRWSLVPWKALDANQQREVEQLQQQAPQWARPETTESQSPLSKRDEATSHALLDHGAVAGWLIAHRVGRSLFRVSQWWVAPELQGSGIALLLLYQAISDALRAIPTYNSVSFGFAIHNRSMQSISARFLEPLAISSQNHERATITFHN